MLESCSFNVSGAFLSRFKRPVNIQMEATMMVSSSLRSFTAFPVLVVFQEDRVFVYSLGDNVSSGRELSHFKEHFTLRLACSSCEMSPLLRLCGALIPRLGGS